MKYNLFIGRYQSPHKGHMSIFENFIGKGLPVLIAVRDIEPDVNNPLTAEQVKMLWDKVYAGNPLVKVMIIPDIDSVNYGREVGYKVNEIEVGADIASISATNIRNQILSGVNDWKDYVDERIYEMLEDFINLQNK